MTRSFLFTGLSAAVLLAGCGQDNATAPEKPVDPAVAGALGDQIMVDPDLVGQNDATALADFPTGEGGVPSLDMGGAAVARAREQAVAMVGGQSAMRKAPPPGETAGAMPADAALTAAARAAAGGQAPCAAKVTYTAAWAAKLPAPFPVYPLGAVQEAAGTDEGGCALRVVNFQIGVPLADVMDFYFTRAAKAGFSAQRVLQDGDDVLSGTRGAASFVMYARRLPSGATEVDLVTSGG